MSKTNKPTERVVKFINKHHVLTLATSLENEPYCANCFYIYLEEENAFVFTSDEKTKHIQDALENNSVAGSVVLETNVIGKIRGIQFNGKLLEPSGKTLKKAKKVYLKRFPYARLMDTRLWILELSFIKMTDNRLGFGKKIIWEKEED